MIDTGVFIELLEGTHLGLKFKEHILNDPYISQFLLSPFVETELKYLLCRNFGFKKAKKIVESFLKDFFILSELELRNQASKLKCKYPISIADCYSLSIAKLNSIPVYYKKEQEITEKIELLTDFQIKFIDNL